MNILRNISPEMHVGVRFMICALGAVGFVSLIATGNSVWILPSILLGAGGVVVVNLFRFRLQLSTQWHPHLFVLCAAAMMGNATVLFSAEFYLWSIATVFAMLLLGLTAQGIVRLKSRPVWIDVNPA